MDRAILITCIGIAFVFWLLVKLSQTYQTEKKVLFSLSIPDGKALVEMPPDDVSVELEAAGWDLMFDHFAEKVMVLPIDLRETDELTWNRGQLLGEIRRKLSSNGIQIEQVNYDNLVFVLEEKVSRTVPVILNATFEFSAEYHLQSPVVVEPDSVTVSGPVSLVNEIVQWETDSLILKNLTSNTNARVPLVAPPRELFLDRKTVEVQIQVEQFTEKSIFVPVTIINTPPDSIKIFPETIKLSGVIGLSQYNDLTYEDFTITADLKDVRLKEGKNTVPVTLTRQPSHVQNVKLSRNSVEFYIVKD